MPRLTNKTYLHQRKQLQHPEADWYISQLSAVDRRALFDFYVYNVDLSDHEALHHRVHVTGTHPSLPHRAGKAFHRLLRDDYRSSRPMPVPAMAKSGRRAHGPITVRSELTPQPDLARALRALVAWLAEEDQRQSNEQAQPDD